MENESKEVKLLFTPNPQGAFRFLMALVLLTLFLFLAVSAKNAFERGGRDPIARNTISVNATAKRSVKPDIAQASFTIRKENASLETARNEVSTLSNKVTDFLKNKGVEEKDIKSMSFNIYPQERDESIPCIVTPGSSDYRCPPHKTIKTFVVEETFEVKMRDLNKVGELIAGVSAAGVNQISSLRFTVDDGVSERLRKEARDEAIAKAREEAKKLSKSLGVRLGDLVNFNEYGGSEPPIIYSRFAKEGLGGDAIAAPSPTIAPGENEIVSIVSLLYEIR